METKTVARSPFLAPVAVGVRRQSNRRGPAFTFANTEEPFAARGEPLGLDYSAVTSSTEKTHGEKRCEIEQQNTNLIHRHASVVKRVKLFIGHTKPCAVYAPHPVMGEHKGQKPHKEDPVVDNRAPEKNVSREFNIHLSLFLAT